MQQIQIGRVQSKITPPDEIINFSCFLFFKSTDGSKGRKNTFYWNLPSQVEQMARQQETKWEVFQSTAGGATLRDHWQGNKGLKTKNLYQKINLIELFFKTIVLIQSNKKILRPIIFLN